MRLIDLLRLAIGRLGTGKLRTALTMLGIIIGVATVVALVSVAQGATKGISNQLNALGTNLLTVNPGFSRGSATRGSFGSATTLTIDDGSAIAGLSGVAVRRPRADHLQARDRGHPERDRPHHRHDPGISLGLRLRHVDRRLSQPGRDRYNLRVAVIGGATADNLDLTNSSIGSTIYIGGLPFDLIGIMQSKGGTGTQDDEVIVPLSTMQELFVGSASVSTIGVSATSQDDINTVSAEITALLDQRHGITAPRRPTSRSPPRPSCWGRSALSATS